jgi:hypothetical protein
VIHLRHWLVLILLVTVFAACSGEGRLNITGKVLKGGAPLAVPDDEYVRVTFFPISDDGGPPKNTYAASYDAKSATFRAVGPDGLGIPPGNYRVAVEHEKGRRDLFKGAYDGDRSPFVFDIDLQTKLLVIDLGN